MYIATVRRVRAIIIAVEKQCVKYSECLLVVLGIQHATRMHRIILSSVACPAVLYFSTYLINGTI
jgi:hypothetical protein